MTEPASVDAALAQIEQAVESVWDTNVRTEPTRFVDAIIAIKKHLALVRARLRAELAAARQERESETLRAEKYFVLADELEQALAALQAQLRALLEEWRKRSVAQMMWTSYPERPPIRIHTKDVQDTLRWCANDLAALLDPPASQEPT